MIVSSSFCRLAGGTHFQEDMDAELLLRITMKENGE